MTSDRDQSILWAREVVAHPDQYLVLDTETTGLGWGSEIVQIAIATGTGEVKINTLVKPTFRIPHKVIEIHGITDAMVATAPGWPDVWPQVNRIITGRNVIIYNAGYDINMLKSSNAMSHVKNSWPIESYVTTHCAMLRYAAFCGEWDDYRQSYRWQKLTGGDHSALGDVVATIELIKRMAAAQLGGEE